MFWDDAVAELADANFAEDAIAEPKVKPFSPSFCFVSCYFSRCFLKLLVLKSELCFVGSVVGWFVLVSKCI